MGSCHSSVDILPLPKTRMEIPLIKIILQKERKYEYAEKNIYLSQGKYITFLATEEEKSLLSQSNHEIFSAPFPYSIIAT